MSRSDGRFGRRSALCGRSRCGGAWAAVLALLVFNLLILIPCAGYAGGAGAPARAQALGDLSAEASARFEIGAAIFAAEWVGAPDVSDGADGLGPLYSARSCVQCHSVAIPARPPAGAPVGVRHVLRLLGDEGLQAGDPRYGRQLQDKAIAGLSAEGRYEVQWIAVETKLGDGRTVRLRRPKVVVEALASGPLAAGTRVSLRRPSAIEGLGLIATIADDDIAAGADPEDRNGDGIRGRVGLAIDPGSGQMRLARFGWQASAVTLGAQTADAFHLDMGLSSPFHPDPSGDCTASQTACRMAPDGRSAAKAGHEVSAQEIALIVAYLEGLAPTSGRDGAGARALQHPSQPSLGEDLFRALNCSGCHRPSFTTRSSGEAPHLSGKTVALFSDLLLHDMGDELAIGGRGDTGARAVRSTLWRTAPLWGLEQRLDEISAGRIDGLLHDGRARTIEEAILWHGGEGDAAREGYKRLSDAERSALLAYLRSL